LECNGQQNLKINELVRHQYGIDRSAISAAI
jgi:hypothetical protein